MPQARCKISRRLGINLFQKCAKAYSRRPYPPGPKKKRSPSPLSEYGHELREKQKLRYLYNIKERQFRNYVKDILKKGGKVENAPAVLMQTLERRLDNVVFRLGFAVSRQQARQMVSHGHFMVNQRKVNIPSYQVKIGDRISVRPRSIKKAIFQNIELKLAKYELPSWLKLDKKTLQAHVVGYPSFEEIAPPVEIASIFEFYSR